MTFKGSLSGIYFSGSQGLVAASTVGSAHEGDWIWNDLGKI